MSGHRCPAPRCVEHVLPSKLACRRHWAMVPAPLQRELYAAWDRGRGSLSDRHLAAIDAVTEFLATL